MIKCIFETNHFFTSRCNLELDCMLEWFPFTEVVTAADNYDHNNDEKPQTRCVTYYFVQNLQLKTDY